MKRVGIVVLAIVLILTAAICVVRIKSDNKHSETASEASQTSDQGKQANDPVSENNDNAKDTATEKSGEDSAEQLVTPQEDDKEETEDTGTQTQEEVIVTDEFYIELEETENVGGF